MMLVDYVIWTAILIGGLVLAVWYGVSWRVVAKALAEGTQVPAEPPPASPVEDTTQTATAQAPPADVLVEART